LRATALAKFLRLRAMLEVKINLESVVVVGISSVPHSKANSLNSTCLVPLEGTLGDDDVGVRTAEIFFGHFRHLAADC